MTLPKSTCLKFYKREDIQEVLIAHAKNKEIAVRYEESFGKRPDILVYPRDVLELALRGTTSFHASEERWSNPLSLSSTSSKKELDELRTGWDLVLDIDCKVMEYSRIAADLIVKFLEYCEVKDISCKFSGNKGFHLGIPFEAFPQQVGGIPTKDLFPEAPRKIALYVKEHIKEELARRILLFEGNDLGKIANKVGLSSSEIFMYVDDNTGNKRGKLLIDTFLEIDTVLLSSRHLYRMPYSLHEKSGLVSLPLDPSNVLSFEKEMARPEKVLAPTFSFLPRDVHGESARRLLLQAWDFEFKQEVEKEEKESKQQDFSVTSPVSSDFFPPCMKLILQGLEDGKKRGLFCLSSFLGKVGWSREQTEKFIHEWNTQKNREPLREVYIKGQLAHFTPGERLPPNCSHEAYYKGIGVCKPDDFCRRIKNPANYTLLKWKRHMQEKEDEEEKKKDAAQRRKEEQ